MNVFLLNYITTKSKENDKTLKVKSFELPMGKKTPPNRFVSAYGTKTTSLVLSEARRKAIKNKNQLYRVDLLIDGGDLPRGKISLKVLPDIKFLNLERIHADISSAIMDILLQIKTDEDLHTPMKVLADDPSRFDLLWDDPMFEHITTFVWSSPFAAKNPKKTLKLAITKDISLFEKAEIRNYKGPVLPELEFVA